jgi:hypothetical protein
VICDPFVGCGTNQLEAAVLGRYSVGYDVDPLATFVTSAKLGVVGFGEAEIQKYANRVLKRLEAHRDRRDYDALMVSDISRLNGAVRRVGLATDAAEVLGRWFRKYVIEDLATILGEIRATRCDAGLKQLALLAFASVIRACSKADPVPVSGLEYTKRMRELDKLGRRIDPYALYERRLRQIVKQAAEFSGIATPTVTHRTRQHDVTSAWPDHDAYDLITFSPPYLSAVEYSRRHKLEMAWLKLIDTHEQFVGLANRYIGHRAIGTEASEEDQWGEPYVDRIRKKLLEVDYKRARSFIKYCKQMHGFFAHAALRMRRGSALVMVVGDNTTAGIKISADRVMKILAQPLTLTEQHSYSLRNRYMTYSRHNGASIGSERILVFRR